MKPQVLESCASFRKLSEFEASGMDRIAAEQAAAEAAWQLGVACNFVSALVIFLGSFINKFYSIHYTCIGVYLLR